MPTSTTAASTGASAKAAYAIATTVSKNDSGWSLVGVDEVGVRRDVVERRDEGLLADGLAVEADPLGHRLQVRAGEPADAQADGRDQRLDHPRRGGLAVGAGEVDRGVAALGVAQQLHERLDAVQRRVQLGLGPPAQQRVLDLGVGLGQAGVGGVSGVVSRGCSGSRAGASKSRRGRQAGGHRPPECHPAAPRRFTRAPASVRRRPPLSLGGPMSRPRTRPSATSALAALVAARPARSRALSAARPPPARSVPQQPPAAPRTPSPSSATCPTATPRRPPSRPSSPASTPIPTCTAVDPPRRHQERLHHLRRPALRRRTPRLRPVRATRCTTRRATTSGPTATAPTTAPTSRWSGSTQVRSLFFSPAGRTLGRPRAGHLAGRRAASRRTSAGPRAACRSPRCTWSAATTTSRPGRGSGNTAPTASRSAEQSAPDAGRDRQRCAPPSPTPAPTSGARWC